MQDEKATVDKIDDGIFTKILSKYSVIWIWSILVGLNSGLTSTFYNYRQNNWRILGILLGMIYCVAFFCCIAAWLQLLRVLRGAIIPSIMEADSKRIEDIEKRYPAIGKTEFNEGAIDREYEEKSTMLLLERTTYVKYLNNVLYFLILAIGFKFSAFIVELLFSAFMKND